MGVATPVQTDRVIAVSSKGRPQPAGVIVSSPEETSVRQNRPLVGIAVMLGGVFLGTCMDAALKFAVVRIPTLEIAAIRSLVVLVLSIPLVIRAGGFASLRTGRPWGHALRVATALIATVCFLEGLGRLPLATVIAIGMSSPLFMVAFSVPLLRERVGIHRWAGVLVGFAGVLVVTQPGSAAFEIGVLFALGAAVFFALSMVTVRWLSPTETDISMLFYVNVGTLAAGGAAMPLLFVAPTGFELSMIALGALLILVSQMLTIRAFRLAPVGAVSPFYYTEVIWGAALGWIFWNEHVEAHVWAGSALIVASGIYVAWRERRAKAKP